jgi:hypothetical protein
LLVLKELTRLSATEPSGLPPIQLKGEARKSGVDKTASAVIGLTLDPPNGESTFMEALARLQGAYAQSAKR